MEEDLDHLDGGSNAFLKALQTGKRHVRLWRRVQAECLTVCVPRLPLANRLKLTTELLERHILKPSPLYKDQYQSLERKSVTVTIEGNKIRPADDASAERMPVVQIIAEERFYNEEYQPFMVYCVSKALSKDVEESDAAPPAASPLEELLQRRATCDEYSEWLVNTCPAKTLEECEREISSFVATYVVARGVLPFMTEKVHRLCRLVSSRLASDCPKLRAAEVRADPRLGTLLAEAAESLVFSMAYAKIMIAVMEECAGEIQQMHERVAQHGSSLGARDVGLEDPALDADLRQVCHELRRLAEMRTPVDKRRIWRNVFDLVTAAVQVKSLEVRSKVALTSDELIPLLSLAVIRAGLDTLPAELLYLEQFSFVGKASAAASGGGGGAGGVSAAETKTGADSQGSYHLITMLAVKQFLLSADVFGCEHDTAGDVADRSGRGAAGGAGGGSALLRGTSGGGVGGSNFSPMTSGASSRIMSSATAGSSQGAGAATAAHKSVAEAMLKARRSTQQLAISGAALATEDGGSASSSRRTSGEFRLRADGENEAGRGEGTARPEPSEGSPRRAPKPSSASRAAPPSGPRKIQLPELKEKERPSDDDVGPLLRKLRGF